MLQKGKQFLFNLPVAPVVLTLVTKLVKSPKWGKDRIVITTNGTKLCNFINKNLFYLISACVNCVRWSNNGKYLASAGDDKLIMIWQIRWEHGNLQNFCMLKYEPYLNETSNCKTSLVGWFMVLNATFNNISVISWPLVLLVEETRVPGENHRPVPSYWQTWSHNVVSSTPRLSGFWTHNFSDDEHWLQR